MSEHEEEKDVARAAPDSGTEKLLPPMHRFLTPFFHANSPIRAGTSPPHDRRSVKLAFAALYHRFTSNFHVHFHDCSLAPLHTC